MKIRLMVAGLVVAAFAACAFGADEITMMNQLSLSKGYLSLSKGVDAKATMYGASYDQRVTTFDTNSANRLAVSSSVATGGVAFIRNLTTNCYAIVTATFELFPGETVMGRLLNTNVTVYASTNLMLGVSYGVLTNVSGSVTNIYTNTLPTAVSVESIILAQ